MLANADRLGDDAFFVIGPIAIFFALAVWVTMTLMTSRHPRTRRPAGDDGMPHRGPVQGGVLQGSPSQRTRRDPAPSVTHRQVMRHIEVAREREEREAREDQAPRGRGGGRGRKREQGKKRTKGKGLLRRRQ
ncbi:hypothetical protein [Actinomadura sp. 3N407]|uniref:hypothetical protein n=1 Tax=Actinomadura sp. 3N407 TaxID=3457423 RepID=UPI003FCE45C4